MPTCRGWYRVAPRDFARVVRTTRTRGHDRRPIEEPRYVDAYDRRWHHAEVRQRGVSSADPTHAEERLPELPRFGELLQGGARIGHDDAMLRQLALSDSAANAIIEVAFENVGFEGGAGLA